MLSHPLVHSANCPQQPGPKQVKAGSWKLSPNLLHAWQEPNRLSQPWCPLGSQSQKRELGTDQGHSEMDMDVLTGSLPIKTLVPEWLFITDKQTHDSIEANRQWGMVYPLNWESTFFSFFWALLRWCFPWIFKHIMNSATCWKPPNVVGYRGGSPRVKLIFRKAKWRSQMISDGWWHYWNTEMNHPWYLPPSWGFWHVSS